MSRRPKPESHSNIVTSPPLLNFCGGPPPVITVPATPAPTSPDTHPPSGNPAKMLTSNSEIPHVVTIMIERPPISICLVCVKYKRFLNTGGFHTKHAFRFDTGTMVVMRLVLKARNISVHKRS